MEFEYPAEIIIIEYECDTCSNGKMVDTGEAMLLVNPPLYPHKCDSCEVVANLNNRYPTVKHRTVNA
jgi:hypothetical protein